VSLIRSDVHVSNVRLQGFFFYKIVVTKHIRRNDFAPDYETWVFHDKQYNTVVAEEEVNDQTDTNRMDEMIDGIQPMFNLDTKDPPTREVEEFFILLEALEESLHEHTKVILLAFVIQLLATKSKFFFSNNFYNELFKLVGDVLPQPNKLSKDMYHSKKLVKGLATNYQKIDVYQNKCACFFRRSTRKKRSA
jgi:hypothetical protein